MIPGGEDIQLCVAPNPMMKCPEAGDDRVTQHTGLVAIHSVSISLTKNYSRFSCVHSGTGDISSCYKRLRTAVTILHLTV